MCRSVVPPARVRTRSRLPGRMCRCRIGQHAYLVPAVDEFGSKAESRRHRTACVDDGQEEASPAATGTAAHPVGARQIKVCSRSAASRSTVLRRFGRDCRPRESSPSQLGIPNGKSARGMGA